MRLNHVAAGVLLVVLLPLTARAAIPATERQALLDFYNGTGGPSWNRNGVPTGTNWGGAPGTECTWDFVTCDAGQTTVTGLSIGYNNLTGALPSTLGNLTGLVTFDIVGNEVTGPIPSSIGNCSNLETLRLNTYTGGNRFTGQFPSEIGNLSKLRELVLSSTALTGPIPASFADLTNIEILDIVDNDLSGTLPGFLFQRTKLKVLKLSANDFTGAIPTPIVLPDLEILSISVTRISGAIPSDIGQLTNLTSLSLGSNQLSGAIPSSIANLVKLVEIDLYNNELTGSLSTFTGLVNLETLTLAKNRLTGGIPSSIGNLTNLERLHLGSNDLGGAIPPEIGNLERLIAINLESNGLTGPIPPDLGSLPLLSDLRLGYNELTGGIPAGLSSATALSFLELRNNQLSGTIPDSTLSPLTNLRWLDLRINAFTGPLPAAIGTLSKLEFLGLGNNRFDGSIPAGIWQLPALRWLYVGGNQLTGPIPTDVSKLPAIMYLDLSANDFSGAIPPEIGTLGKLIELSLDDNRLTGTIPTQLGQLANLTLLDLGENDLTGEIPSDLGSLSKLEFLDLGRNRLSGPIPPELGQLAALDQLSVSQNQLRGALPAQLMNMTGLDAGGSTFSYNALFTNDSALRAFINSKQAGGDFEATQTVAPTNVAVSAAREKSLVLSWTPIRYTRFNGGYMISVASSASGPFQAAVTTPDKLSSTFTLDGLTSSTDYFVRVSTATYSNYQNPNSVVSDPSPLVTARTTTGTPAPASVVVLRYPGGIYQDAGVAGGRDSYTLANVGDLPTTVTLTQEGDFFTQSPTQFALGPGSTQNIGLTGLARADGVFTGVSIPSGAGVPAGLRVPVRLLSKARVLGTVNAVASTNRVDVAAEPAQTSLPASVSFTNTGTATLSGILVTEASWITLPQGIVTIAPGQTFQVDFTVDRTKRSDAAELAGTAISSLSLVYPTGAGQGARSTHDGGSSTGTSLVTVVDTVKPPTNSVPFPPLQPGEVPVFLPGVGHVVGGVGLFLSDLSVINAFGTDALGDIRMYYTPAVGYPLTTSVTTANAVSPGQSFALADVVKSVFKTEQVGTIQIRSLGWSSLVLSSNIFNVTNPRGTFGSSIPSFRGDRSLEAGASLLINGLKKDATTRTNVFIQETSGLAASADLVFYDAAGTVVPAPNATSAALPAFQLVRLLDAVPPGAVSAKITNRGDSPGRITAYATPVDQTSGDFWSLADWSRVYASLQDEAQIIPVAGKVRGANNTFFRSDVSITAAGSAPAAASLRFYYYNGGVASADASISLAASETRVLEDIVGTLFPTLPQSVVGYIVLTPSAGSLAVTSRTYATQDGVTGTYGTAVPTLPLSRTIRLGQTKIIAGLDVASEKTIGAKTPATFRTNLYLVEASGAPAKVRVTVVYADRSQPAFGSRLITKTIDLAANEIYQTNVTQLIADTNPAVGDLRNVQLEFRVVDGDGAVFAFTSSIDNGTADQILRVE